jgi:hypothetical protein
MSEGGFATCDLAVVALRWLGFEMVDGGTARSQKPPTTAYFCKKSNPAYQVIKQDEQEKFHHLPPL